MNYTITDTVTTLQQRHLNQNVPKFYACSIVQKPILLQSPKWNVEIQGSLVSFIQNKILQYNKTQGVHAYRSTSSGECTNF